jgi:glycerol-3-phosphate dehydrogenase
MSSIDCDKGRAAEEKFDLIIIGGGIHGTMLTLEASLRGIRTLLLEQDDFGAATSFNSLRILHGGFRYLQHLDYQRLVVSARERQWFLRFFPQLAIPLACLMPLYGRGLRRPLILGGAVKLYQLLTERFNRELSSERKIPAGRILSSEETAASAPWIIRKGLQGGAVWYDGFMPDTQRILIGALRWACDHGATAINYCQARSLITHAGRVVGVRACDRKDGASFEFRSDVVINAAGPWCREVAVRFDRDHPRLFNRMVAWNVLFDRPAVSSYAMAVSPPRAGARTYFVVPWKGLLFAGTGQVPWAAGRDSKPVREHELDAFCREINMALPALALKREDILHVYAGQQSANLAGGNDFTHRDVFVDHSHHGGPQNLYSISGIKFTTARRMAESTLNKVFFSRRHIYTGKSTHFYDPPSDISQTFMLFDYDWQPPAGDDAWHQTLQPLIAKEAVQHLDDLVLRRSNLGDNPQRALAIAGRLSELFDWDDARRRLEIKRLQDSYRRTGPEKDTQNATFN